MKEDCYEAHYLDLGVREVYVKMIKLAKFQTFCPQVDLIH